MAELPLTPVQTCQCRGDEQGGRDGLFWCACHQLWKNRDWHRLCRYREDYREAWNEGVGPGQLPHVGRSQSEEPVLEGPGTELKKLLAKWWIYDRRGCKCKTYEHIMNMWGPARCEERMDTILSWMRREAKHRHLPFIRALARRFVRKAIRHAEQHYEFR